MAHYVLQTPVSEEVFVMQPKSICLIMIEKLALIFMVTQ